MHRERFAETGHRHRRRFPKVYLDFTGKLSIHAGKTDLEFDTKVNVTDRQTVVFGALSSTGALPSLEDLVRALGFQASIPDGLNIQFKSLQLGVRIGNRGERRLEFHLHRHRGYDIRAARCSLPPGRLLPVRQRNPPQLTCSG